MRSNVSVSASRPDSAIASGWSAKRAAIACGLVSTCAWLPRRSGSEASSVVCSRIATNASCRYARSGACAWTLPVATVGDAEPLGEPRQAAVQRAVVARERALQLDAKGVAAEGAQQAPHRRLVADAAARAAAEADEAGMVRLDVVERHGRLRAIALGPLARVGMRARQQVAEAAPAGRVADEQREMTPVGERDLRPVDRPQAERLGRLRELHRARQRVVVGERERRVAAVDGGRHELLGLRGAVEERVGGVAVQLGVRHTNTCSHTGRSDCAVHAAS